MTDSTRISNLQQKKNRNIEIPKRWAFFTIRIDKLQQMVIFFLIHTMSKKFHFVTLFMERKSNFVF